MGEFEFVISEGPEKGRAYAFPGPHFYVGASDECHLRLPAAVVQAKHAEVRLDPNGVPWIRDLTGQKLMWLNGEQKDKAALQPGAFVRLGRVELVVRQQGATGSGTMRMPTPLRTDGAISALKPASSARNQPVHQSSPRIAALSPDSNQALDATARRPTPFARPGTNPLQLDDRLNNPDDGLMPPDDATHISSGPTSSILTPGTVIDGRYEVVGKLAAGGMGEVYRAQHVELGKPMAVKVMLPELSNDPEFVARFKREAIAASRIGQQNIVDISDFGRTQNGRFYFVMEYLDGMTLSSLLHRQGAQPPERVVNISAQVARALAAAHAQSIVHRDLKPENVMLLQRPGQPDFVKVLDFGVAKVSTGHGQGGHTAVGMVVGTPQYMSPEQAKAIPVDIRSDIYSLGLIVYELITGRPTFSAETPSMLMVKHVTEAPPPLVPGPLADVPEDLEQLVFKMLEKEPDARPQSMEEVLAVLDSLWARLKSNDPTLKRVSGSFAPTATPRPAPSGVAMLRASGQVPAVTTNSTTGLQEAVVAPRSKAPIIALSVVVALLAVAVLYVLSREEPKPQPPVVIEKPVVVEKPVEKPTEPTVEKVKLTFTTTPEKVDVLEGEVLVGSTPFTLSRDVSTLVELTFQARGYKSVTRKVRFESEQTISIELEKEKKSGGVGGTKKQGGGLADDPYSQTEDLKESPF